MMKGLKERLVTILTALAAPGLLLGGCATGQPHTPATPPPARFRSVDGQVTVTALGALRSESTRPSSRTKLEWFLYGPDEETGSSVRRPQGLAFAAGNLFIADQGFPDVLRYDLSTRSYHRWIRSLDRPNCPIAVAADDRGCVFVIDAATRSLRVFDSGGRQRTELALDTSKLPNFRPSALLWHQEILYVADAGARQVHRFDCSKNAWLAPLGPAAGIQALAMPTGLAVTNRGVLLVTDGLLGLIHRFDGDGKLLAAMGEYGGEQGQLIRPTGIACTPSGLILVTDAGRESLMVFDQDGGFLVEVAAEPKQWNGLIVPSSVAVLPSSSISIAQQLDPAENVEPKAEWAAVSDTLRGTISVFSIVRASPAPPLDALPTRP